MKLNKLAVSLLALDLFASTAVFAREGNKTSLNIFEKVTVNGKTLNPGKYTVDWQGTGSTVQVNILQGKQTVATATARVSEQPTRNDNNAYGSSAGPDGTRELTTIYVGGQRTTLNFGDSQSAQSSASSSSK